MRHPDHLIIVSMYIDLSIGSIVNESIMGLVIWLFAMCICLRLLYMYRD